MPTVENPGAFSLSQFATGFTSYVTNEIYDRILMDARIRDVYDHELIRKTTTSAIPIKNHLLLRFREPTMYENFDLPYLISGHDKYRTSTSTSLMFKEWGDAFLEEGIHHDKFIIYEIDHREFKVEPYMRITGMNEVAHNYFKDRHRDANPRHTVFTKRRIVHYVYVNSQQFRTDGFIHFAVKRDDSLDYIFREADFHNLHPQDIQDMYLSNISFLYTPGNEDDILDSLRILMRSKLALIHIDDFKMGVESLQKMVNLTHPMIILPGIEEYEPSTCIENPLFELGIVYKNASGIKRLMITNEISKFSSGTLKWVLKGIYELLN